MVGAAGVTAPAGANTATASVMSTPLGVSFVALMVPTTALIVSRLALFRAVGATDTLVPLMAPALMGMTGLTTGPHVHWEAKRNGMIVDPLAQ